MFCNKCGSELKDDAKFCNSCGNPITPKSKAKNNEAKTEVISPGTDKAKTEVIPPANTNDKTAVISPANTNDDSAWKPTTQPAQTDQTAVMPPIQQANTNQPINPTYDQQAANYAPQQQQKGKNTGLKVLLIVLIVIAVLVVGALVCILLGNNGVKNPISDLFSNSGNEQKTVIIEKEKESTKSDSSSSNSSNSSSDYLCPESNVRVLSDSELNAMSTHDLFIARNEIYARHGRGFKNAELINYFNGKSWYHKVYEPAEFDSHIYGTMSQIEKTNGENMLKIEKARNSPYINS